MPLTCEATLAGRKFFMAHGHTYHVRQGYMDFLEEAVCRGADVAVYGHTHQALCRFERGVQLLNPGAMLYADPTANTFGIIELDEKGLGCDILKLSNFV